MIPQGKLKPGTWIFVGNLTPETTEETLSEYFCGCGLSISPEDISLRNRGFCCTALVRVPAAVVVMLVEWALNGRLLDGRLPRINPVGKPEEVL